MSPSDLPMEVWARIASFIPFPDLLRTFHTLQAAGALPDTHTTPSNALLQFCAEHGHTDEDDEFADMMDVYVAMGFSVEHVRHALRHPGGDIIDTLLRM